MIRVLTGENDFALQRALHDSVRQFIHEYSDLGLERLDGEEIEFDRIREALESLPFLAAKKLVVLRTPGVNKQFVERAEDLFAGLPATTELIIVEPKLDKRSGYYKLLKKQSGFEEFKPLDENGLAKWLMAEARTMGGELKPTDARYLVERAGARQQLLANELAKLLAYDQVITRAHIDLLIEPNHHSTTFELLDAAFGGRKAQVLRLYDEQRQAKVEPQIILGLIAWQLYALALVKAGQGRDVDAMIRETKLSPYTLRKSQAIVARRTLAELKRLVHDTLALDLALKQRSIDADDAIKNLLVSL